MPLTVGVPEMVPLADMESPAGRPVAENVYGPPDPPVPTRVTGTIAKPCTAVIDTQVAEGVVYAQGSGPPKLVAA